MPCHTLNGLYTLTNKILFIHRWSIIERLLLTKTITNNSDDYFRCMKHNGLRPVTYHTTPSCRIGWLCTYHTKCNMRDCFSICQWCPPNLVGRRQFQPADHVPVQHTGPLSGNQTHDLRLTILDLDHLASGKNHYKYKGWCKWWTWTNVSKIIIQFLNPRC